MQLHHENKKPQIANDGRFLIELTREVITQGKNRQITEIFEAYTPLLEEPDKIVLEFKLATLAYIKAGLKQANITIYPTRGITQRQPVSAALMCQMLDARYVLLFVDLQLQLATAVQNLNQAGKKLTSDARLYEASRLIRTLAMPEGRWLLELIFRLDPFKGNNAQALLEILLKLRNGPAKKAGRSIRKDLGAFAELLWIAFDLALPDGMTRIFAQRSNKSHSGARGQRGKYTNRTNIKEATEQDVIDFAPPEALELLTSAHTSFYEQDLPPDGSTLH